MARAAPQLRLVSAETTKTQQVYQVIEERRSGEATKAGTGCGSCKGELGQLVSTLVRKPAAALQVAN